MAPPHDETDHLPFDRIEREAVLRRLGASSQLLPEILRYTENPYRQSLDLIRSRGLPLLDEPHVAAWRDYEQKAAAEGVWEVLRGRLLQLRFPVRSGMSQDPGYLAATRRGTVPAAKDGEDAEPGLELAEPEALRLSVHPTLAGAVPVIVAGHRADFVALVRALTARNEPAPVPDSMGACLVKGLVNWDRVASHRRAWEASFDTAPGEDAWKLELARLAARKELYQDRLLLLSTGPYSAVEPVEAGTGPEQWLADSLVLRREHECFHYLTLRLFGLIRSNLLDEILADAAGLLALHSGNSGYSRALALRFLGITDQEPPALVSGARLELYRGDPPLPEAAVAVLARLARAAVETLERIVSALAAESRNDPAGRTLVLLTLAAMGLEQLAGASGQERFAEHFRDFESLLHRPAPWSFDLAAGETGIAACLEDFHRHSSDQGLRAETRRKLGVVLDEILTNVAKYAFSETAHRAQGAIRVELRTGRRGAVELVVEDSGSPFNPLYQPASPTLAPLAERRVGGLGIYLVRHLASRLHYERRGDRNRLVVELG